MAPRVDTHEREVILSLILKRRDTLIEQRSSRNADLNQERESQWNAVLEEAKKELKRKDLTMIRVKTILRNAMNMVKTLGQVTRRYESQTGGGNDQELEDEIRKMHDGMCPAEAEFFEYYHESPAVSGIHPLGDSMILADVGNVQKIKMSRASHTAKMQFDEHSSNDDSCDTMVDNYEGINQRCGGTKRKFSRRINSMRDTELLDKLRGLVDQREEAINSHYEINLRKSLFEDDDEINIESIGNEGAIDDATRTNLLQRLAVKGNTKRREGASAGVELHKPGSSRQSLWDAYAPPKAQQPQTGQRLSSEKKIRDTWMECLEAQKDLLKSQTDAFREQAVTLRKFTEFIEHSEERMERVTTALIATMDGNRADQRVEDYCMMSGMGGMEEEHREEGGEGGARSFIGSTKQSSFSAEY